MFVEIVEFEKGFANIASMARKRRPRVFLADRLIAVGRQSPRQSPT